jgi:hypothetical protein
MLKLTAAALALAATISAYAQPLPPPLQWPGKSRRLIARPDNPWITPAERSNFQTTPNYDETTAWLRRLTTESPELRMISLGKSAEGRDIWMVIASREHFFTPEALTRSGKPVLLAQAGIHAGEIDGKDAGLILLRELTFGRSRELLDRVNLLFVPILNVDGHERASKYNRINQRGPEVMGWRTNARNLNLNRDFTKLDADETRAIVAALDRWHPDLYVDLHVTDGADYQYDITFGWNDYGYSPSATRWMNANLRSSLMRDLENAGHIPGPLIFPLVDNDLSQGLLVGQTPPRFATGYGDARHIASVLVENHSLKPYEQRVLGTVVALQGMLEVLSRAGMELRQAGMADSQLRVDPVPLTWKAPQTPSGEIMQFLGVQSRSAQSPISGTARVEYVGVPVPMRLPVVRESQIATTVRRAKAYWIPAAWDDIAQRLRIHGVTMEKIPAAREVDVDMYRLRDPKVATEPFEGHIGVTASTAVEARKERFPAGSYRVPTDQPLGDLVTLLLEPSSPDSFFQWGFMHEILQRTEYFEPYVVEPLAQQMMADPKIAAEFQHKLETDEQFRASAQQRLHFFYERSPYFDDRWLLYPIARER